MDDIVYPIEYRTIPTQYGFLVKKVNGKYIVQVHACRNLQDNEFATEVEARKFISQKEII